MWITIEKSEAMKNLPPKGRSNEGLLPIFGGIPYRRSRASSAGSIYLSALRGPNRGVYEHHGLSLVFGPRAANEALRRSHEEVFANG